MATNKSKEPASPPGLSEEIGSYLDSVPAEHQPTLTALRDLILELVPEAEALLPAKS